LGVDGRVLKGKLLARKPERKAGEGVTGLVKINCQWMGVGGGGGLCKAERSSERKRMDISLQGNRKGEKYRSRLMFSSRRARKNWKSGHECSNKEKQKKIQRIRAAE